MGASSAEHKAEPGKGGHSQQLLPAALVAFLRTFLAFFVLAVVFGYGWRITEINLVDLAVNAPRIAPIVRDLLTPDILARSIEEQKVSTTVYLPCRPGDTSSLAPVAGDGARLVVEKPCTEAGQSLKVEGFNLRPSQRGFIRWVPASGAPRTLDRVTTDSQGHFELVIEVPEVEPSTEPHQVEVALQSRRSSWRSWRRPLPWSLRSR